MAVIIEVKKDQEKWTVLEVEVSGSFQEGSSRVISYWDGKVAGLLWNKAVAQEIGSYYRVGSCQERATGVNPTGRGIQWYELTKQLDNIIIRWIYKYSN